MMGVVVCSMGLCYCCSHVWHDIPPAVALSHLRRCGAAADVRCRRATLMAATKGYTPKWLRTGGLADTGVAIDIEHKGYIYDTGEVHWEVGPALEFLLQLRQEKPRLCAEIRKQRSLWDAYFHVLQWRESEEATKASTKLVSPIAGGHQQNSPELA